MRAVAAASLGLSAAVADACSGLHVQEMIRRSVFTGQVGAAVAAVMLLLAVVLRLRIASFVCFAGLAFHPAWTTSAVSGDCGGAKVTMTYLSGMICGGILLWDGLRRVKVSVPLKTSP